MALIVKQSAVFLLSLLLVSSCYHMRVEPVPIDPKTFESARDVSETAFRIRSVFENYLGIKIVSDHQAGAARTFETQLHQFANETGLGQPPGGRQNLSRFRITITPAEKSSVIRVTPFQYQIQTSYAYNEGGEVKYLQKNYPYEEYPGMFEVGLIRNELERIQSVVSERLKD